MPLGSAVRCRDGNSEGMEVGCTIRLADGLLKGWVVG